MGTHNICLYKEVDKKYTGWILKTTELLDCVLISGMCSNKVEYGNLYLFVWIQHGCLANTVPSLDPVYIVQYVLIQ